MSKVERFEDLIAWQKARILTRDIYQVTQQGAFARDFGLSGQIQGRQYLSCLTLQRDLKEVI